MQHHCRHFLQIPDDAQRRQQPQAVVRYIDFPPKKALPRRAGKVVMVVVPAFAEGEKREPQVVARIVARGVAAPPIKMRKRVDGKGGVIQHHGGYAKAPHHHLPAAGLQRGREMRERFARAVERKRKQQRHQRVVAIEKTQFGILHQAGHMLEARGEIFACHEPTYVAPEKAVLARRVHVLRLIRMHVMMAVL